MQALRSAWKGETSKNHSVDGFHCRPISPYKVVAREKTAWTLYTERNNLGCQCILHLDPLKFVWKMDQKSAFSAREPSIPWAAGQTVYVVPADTYRGLQVKQEGNQHIIVTVS